MDQFSAHLDRGWELIQRGDMGGAEHSARRALELDAESPEAFNLLGYVATLQGEFEDAVDHYLQAIALDDCYLEAILNAAEVMIHPIGNFEAAERMCDDALDLAESDDERVDALLLKFDALIGQERHAAAKELCERFPPGPYENPAHAFLVGRALYEIGEVKRAAPLIEQAASLNVQSPDAFYYLGLILDEQGRGGEATRAFLRSRELDSEGTGPAWSLDNATFLACVARAVQSLDTELRHCVDEEQLFVADVPGVEVVIDGVDPRAPLLLDTLTTESGELRSALRVIVYKKNLERIAPTAEALEVELGEVLRRELQAHLAQSARQAEVAPVASE
jgi:Flp pilus assembly protein TadD